MSDSPHSTDGDTSRATLARVAEQAAVSMSTVSKVLNGRPGVAAETRARVETLLSEVGYTRRGAVVPGAPLIEIVFSELDNEWAMELIRGAGATAKLNGMGLIVTQSGTRHAPDPEWIDEVISRQPFGIILVMSDLPPANKDRLRRLQIPFVLVDPSGNPAPDVPSVAAANWDGGLQATNHLIALGHRRIGVIAGPHDVMCARARVSGYRAALESAGLPVDDDLVQPGDFHIEGGLVGGTALLESRDRPTAVFATNDLQAIGVYQAARALNLRVPEDVSIVGFDDLQFSNFSSPPLTTVHNPLYEMAREAARILLDIRAGSPVGTGRRELGTSLVVRESSVGPA
ncbi:LacI family DNA-binding transcriptional regulator [Microbacterium aoyamense]|uniref:LacI family DNA-binding transcriptional regulator n=1 Tax=Microbacterium aoyamense TaxID=344166 RepID=A0ABN2PDW6_9MICO|nr:LacI family DNA-binding transcriptional regulator [Microbacterium aoyamense]